MKLPLYSLNQPTTTQQIPLSTKSKNVQNFQDFDGSHLCRDDSERKARGVLLAGSGTRECPDPIPSTPESDLWFTADLALLLVYRSWLPR